MKTIDNPPPLFLPLVNKMKTRVANDLTRCLYKLHAQRVYSKCLKMTKSEDDAHDLSQEIWIKVQRSITSFNYNSSPSTWLHAVTHNHCIDFLRRKNRQTRLYSAYKTEQNDKEESCPSEHELINDKQLSDRLMEQVRTLAQGEKLKILWMKYGKNMSVRDISKALNLSESAVKMRLQRARLQMKKKIELQFSLAS